MRRLIPTLLLAAASVCAGPSLAAAAPGALTVGIHESLAVPLRGEAASVVVGDPNVADVAMTNGHSLILLGRGYGSTQLTVTDRGGRPLLDALVTVVSPDTGRVTVTRALAVYDYACAGGRCHPVGGAAGGGVSAMGATGAAPTAAPADAEPSSRSMPSAPPPGGHSAGGEAHAAAESDAPPPSTTPPSQN